LAKATHLQQNTQSFFDNVLQMLATADFGTLIFSQQHVEANFGFQAFFLV